MKKMLTSVVGLMALALLAGPGIVGDADAEIRIDANLRTPHVDVCIGNVPSKHYRSDLRVRLPISTRHHYKVGKPDRKIAQRLARYTGVPARELIQLRGHGYGWFQIGRWLHLPRPVVRAAMHQKRWKRFLHRERRLAKRDYRRDGRRIAYADDDVYDDD